MHLAQHAGLTAPWNRPVPYFELALAHLTGKLPHFPETLVQGDFPRD